jgi:hypothetical protein
MWRGGASRQESQRQLDGVADTRVLLFQICADEVDEVFREFLRRCDALLGGEQVQADVVLEDLGHQAVDAAAHVGKQHENVGAVVAGGERALDGVDLAADALDAGDELLFFLVDVGHFSLYNLGGYDTTWVARIKDSPWKYTTL